MKLKQCRVVDGQQDCLTQVRNPSYTGDDIWLQQLLDSLASTVPASVRSDLGIRLATESQRYFHHWH